ncbi:GerMN domain-containing protein [Anaerobacillus sp. HL2]|nr:GerMN domain-containing protein [Anaerobacillus sp. HL2]
MIAGPVEEGLQSLVPENVKVQTIEAIDDIVYVSFQAILQKQTWLFWRSFL